MTRRETEALSPGFEGGDGQKRIRWREGFAPCLQRAVTPDPIPAVSWLSRQSAWTAITERAQRLERKSGWSRLGGRDARDDA